LAVATLRAIHSLVVPNVGLLVLDEPTTHLDTEAKLALAEMLRRIGNEGGLQIIVCDHDPVILDACSSVIEIPA
jgi:exonuclease SbcC